MTSPSEIQIVPAEYKHLLALAPVMRTADRCEVMAAGMTPLKALFRSWRPSMIANAGFVDGEIAAVWGMIGSPLGRVGNPWLLTSAAVEKVPRAFLEIGREEVRRMLSLCPMLVGLVDPSYWKAVRFLAFLGYSFGEPVSYGPRGASFLQFRMERQ